MPTYTVQVEIELTEIVEYEVEARDEEHALELAEGEGWMEYVKAAAVTAIPESVADVEEE